MILWENINKKATHAVSNLKIEKKTPPGQSPLSNINLEGLPDFKNQAGLDIYFDLREKANEALKHDGINGIFNFWRQIQTMNMRKTKLI